MAKRNYFLIVDTETTQDSLVADFGAVVVDKTGKEYTRCAILLDTIYNNSKEHPLFFTHDDNAVFGKNTVDYRYNRYNKMLQDGTRGLHTVAAVNRWLERVKGQYDPFMTAYNLPFDLSKCDNTGIDLSIFTSKAFCLWAAAIKKWGQTKAFRQFILDVHGFNPPTELGNMTLKTNAEIMTRFVTYNPELEDEPHTALEDVLYYELPILLRLLKTESAKKLMQAPSYNWREFQVKDAFKAI